VSLGSLLITPLESVILPDGWRPAACNG